MTIDPTRINDIRARTAAEASELADQKKKAAPDEGQRRGDQVEISAEARELARQGGADRIPVTEARLEEIRQRLDAGFYERPEVVREVAERIADSEDL